MTLPQPLTPACRMKRLLKRALIGAYCRGWVSLERCQRIYDFFRLSGH